MRRPPKKEPKLPIPLRRPAKHRTKMTKKTKTVISAAAAIALCLAIAVSAIIIFAAGKGVPHLNSDAGFTLTRESLYVKSLDENGNLSVSTDGTAADFSGRGGNVFGITADTEIVPGSAFSADMTVSNGGSGTPFAYWIEISVDGEVNELVKQLKVTVTVDGVSTRFYLAEGLTAGSERNPLAVVTDKNSSSFSVRIDFEEDRVINDEAQNKIASFDLAVYAAAYTG